MAVYNSSSISRGDPARLGVYPTKAVGNVSIGNVTLTALDTIPLVKIPYGSFISSISLFTPILNPAGAGLTMQLLDTLASPTIYIATGSIGTNFTAAGTWSILNFVPAVFGTMYGATARAVGATGAPVVVWSAGVQLNLKVIASATVATGGTVNIGYMIEFSPAYDAGT